MKTETGAPAFENIDDLLTDKIVNHGRDHADRTEDETPGGKQEQPALPEAPVEPDPKPSIKTVITTTAVLCMLLFIIFRLFKRQQNR